MASPSPWPEQILLRPNGWVPNNARLPVLHYRSALDPATHMVADTFEAMFARHAWPAQWRNGIYDFHHYHSTAHEVLGFAQGSAVLILGGEGGPSVHVEPGDVIVLPAGTGHALASATGEFLVVGGYPAGFRWDTRREGLDASAQARMDALSIPATDPVTGSGGALTRLWQKN